MIKKTTELTTYADDINILSKTSKDAIEICKQFKKTSKSEGLTNNTEKTNVRAGVNASLQGLMEDDLEAVDDFMYQCAEISGNSKENGC